MKRFVEGEDRRQGASLPHCLAPIRPLALLRRIAQSGGDRTIAGPPPAGSDVMPRYSLRILLSGTRVAHPSQVLHDRYNLPDTTCAWSHAAMTSEEPEKECTSCFPSMFTAR